jgi:FKBP-type peptidyl-prolyl cis-trans isomerase 2
MAEKGNRVLVHYIGTLEDGSEFGNSYNLGKPLDVILGAHMVIPGLENAFYDLAVGEKASIRVEPADGYGEYDPKLVQVETLASIPGSETMVVGDYAILDLDDGQKSRVLIAKIEDGKVWLDSNHELAGKVLSFEIELVEEIRIPKPGEPYSTVR